MANDRQIKWRVLDVAVNDKYGSNAVELDVHHSKGGPNYFSGGYVKAGYYFAVSAVQIKDGCMSFVIGGSTGRNYLISEAPRFNARKLEQLATTIKPHTTAIVAALLERNFDGIRGIMAGSLLATVPVPTLELTPKPERRQEA